MASLKCLACGQDNKVGDESCTSCSSSLNLRLCSACEAINATSAERCHSCGAQFGPETEPASTLEEVADRAPSPGRVLPAAWIAGAEQATRRGWRAGAALWLLPIIAVASATYYFYDGAPHAAPAKQPTPEAKQAVLEAKQVVLELAQPAPVVRQPPVAAAKPAPAAESRTSFEPKRALPPVTHTRLAAAATPAKPAPAAAVAASESAPALVERRGRVTHTRAEPAAAAEAGAAQAVAGASVPSTQARVEPAACPPEVVALGLCRSN